MFPTPIGPVGNQHGYLRPETAQGIFLNFKFCLEQNAGQMPFGVAQVGKAFRNEIAPRAGLIRQREFTQAEIEFFCRPGDKPHPKFAGCAHLMVALHPSKEQLAGEGTVMMSLGDAVSKKMIANETLGYFIARTYLFLIRAGCKADHIRFRQHLPDEMAHYAVDCWDAEIEMSLGWVECVGIADRSAYDLTCHGKATNTALTASAPLDKPITVETYQLTKKALAAIGKEFKKDAKTVTAYLSELDEAGLKALEASAKADGEAKITIDGAKFSIDAALIACETKTETQHVEVFVPNVVEPSFGIDRILAAIYEHSFFAREDDKEVAPAAPKEEGGKKKKEKKEEKGPVAGVLGFPAEIAPYKVVVLPLDMRVAAQYVDMLTELRTKLTDNGLQYKVDESGASIGRRYARADELGIPYAVTIDFDTIGIGEVATPAELLGTATLRDRDSTDQVRLPIAAIPEVLNKLCTAHPLSFGDLKAAYATPEAAAASKSVPDGMVEYLNAHGVTAKLNAAVNKLAVEKPADPMAWLVAELSK